MIGPTAFTHAHAAAATVIGEPTLPKGRRAPPGPNGGARQERRRLAQSPAPLRRSRSGGSGLPKKVVYYVPSLSAAIAAAACVFSLCTRVWRRLLRSEGGLGALQTRAAMMRRQADLSVRGPRQWALR